MKRDFYLPEKDRDYLDNLGLEYETIKSDDYGFGYNNMFVIIYGYYVNPDYYKVKKKENRVDVLLQIPSGYPNSQIDMASFYPPLKRVDKKSIPNLHNFYTVKKKKWQTWSRHRTGASSWDPKIDFIGTHMEFVEAFLQKEVGLIESSKNKSTKIKSTLILKEKKRTFILQTKEFKKDENKVDLSAYHGKIVINVGKKKR